MIPVRDRISLMVSLTFGLLLPFLLNSQGLQIGEGGKGWVKGKVIGPYDSTISSAPIIISGDGSTRRTVTDNEGTYEIEVPAGLYTITTEVPNYFPFQRAPFRVKAQTSTLINLSLRPKIPDLGHGEGTQLNYESLPLPNSSSDAQRVVMQFGNRKEDSDIIHYSSAILSYDAWTISASNIEFHKSSFRFRSTDTVVVEDGHQRIYVKQAELYFVRNSPTVDLTRGVVSSVRGQGSIEGDSVSFEFAIEKNLKGSLKYEDKKSDIGLASDQILSFSVIDDELNKIEFHGAGTIYVLSTRQPLNDRFPANFIISVQDDDKTGRDIFSIRLLDRFDRSGIVTRGNIEVHREY